jgi:hypothetical protein
MAVTETLAPGTVPPAAVAARSLPRWPLVLIALPAAVAVWSGWVGLGTLCGFGIVHPLPGIVDRFTINTAITLPVGVEAYGAYALGAWLTPGTPETARRFARNSALGALGMGMAGQVIYHLLAAAHRTAAPWPVVMLVSCLPVLTLGLGGALTHLLRTGHAPAGATAVPLVDDGTAAELRTEVDAVRAALRTEVDAVRGYADTIATEAGRAIEGGLHSLRAELDTVHNAADAEVSAPDRDALVAELADEMRDAITAGERWTPDYAALMKRTGYRRRWCESAVADARTLAFSAPRPDDTRAEEHPARADDGPRTERIQLRAITS